MECRPAKSAELDLLGFRNFFSELDQTVPKTVVSAAFRQFDTRCSGRLSFRDVCFGLATSCISSWEVRVKFLFSMFDSDADGCLTRGQLAELLTGIVTAVRRSNELGGIFGPVEFHLDGLSPPALDRIQSCVTAVQSETCEAFSAIQESAELSLTENERNWIERETDSMMGKPFASPVMGKPFVSFELDFLPWSGRNSQLVSKLLELFEVVPSPDRERRMCAAILSKPAEPGSTWFVVSYKWMQLWRAYVRWIDHGDSSVWIPGSPSASPRVMHSTSDEIGPEGFVAAGRPVSFTSSILHAMSSLDAMSCTSTVIQQRMAERPLAINNSDLEGELKGALRANLIEHHDYLLVPEEMWKLLQDWYGGGPWFPRKLTRNKLSRKMSNTSILPPQSSLSVELYPPLILVVLCGSSGVPIRHFTKRFFVSRVDSCSDLISQLARKLVNKDDASVCRLWHRRSGESWELIQAEDPRRINDFVVGNSTEAGTFMLEVKGADNCWPRDKPTSVLDGESGIEVGDRVDARGSDQIWKSATVVDVTEKAVKVHFDGEQYRLDVWLSCDSDEIAPIHTHVKKSVLKVSKRVGGQGGLMNIGNTCFMNATLQCLAATPMLKEYFLSPEFQAHLKLGPAKVAGEFAALLAALCKAAPVAPTSFKKALEKYAPRFAGYEHQDAHELLAVLLDALHEDLNRGRAKPVPVVSAVASETADAASVAWAQHRSAHSSVIADLFDGQQRISTQCRSCGHCSPLFEAFRYVMLPVPVTDIRQITIHLLPVASPTNPRPRILKLTVSVPKAACLHAVMSACNTQFPHLQVEWDSLVIAEVYLSRIHRFVDVNMLVSEFRSDDKLFAYQLNNPVQLTNFEDAGGDLGGPFFAQIVNRRERTSSRHKSKREVFGLPSILAINPKWTHAQLHAQVRMHMQRFVSVVAPKQPFVIHLVSSSGFDEPGSLLLPSSSKALRLQGAWVYVAVDWQVKSYDDSIDSVMVVPHAEDVAPVSSKPTSVSLEECMDAYTGTEQLVGDNQWLCDQCKTKCDAERKISWSVAPDVLVILLKRFQYTQAGFEKINVPIAFPSSGLVVMPGETYDLYAVVNHFGSLSSGHYTALCREESRWSVYNDHQVEIVGNLNQELVNCARTCYVLFYRRKGHRPSNLINYGPLTQVG